jgi:hypothetical protein
VCFSETGTLPAPPTEGDLDKMRIQRLRGLMKHVTEHFNDPPRLGAAFAIHGFRVAPDDWGKVQTIRDTLVKLWYPGRSGGLC